jgi:hypothetical protein
MSFIIGHWTFDIDIDILTIKANNYQFLPKQSTKAQKKSTKADRSDHFGFKKFDLRK